MKTDKPFKKSLACAGVLFVIIVIVMAVAGAQNLDYRIGAVFAFCLLSALASGAWGYFSGKSWSWVRFVATVICFYIFFAVMAFTNTYKTHS